MSFKHKIPNRRKQIKAVKKIIQEYINGTHAGNIDDCDLCNIKTRGHRHYEYSNDPCNRCVHAVYNKANNIKSPTLTLSVDVPCSHQIPRYASGKCLVRAEFLRSKILPFLMNRE